MTKEEWRPVVGYEGLYSVSSHGRVKSEERELDRNRKWKASYRTQSLSETVVPYYRVTLHRNGVRRTFSVHRLVCESFHGPATPDRPWALHRNGDSLDNRPENLYWGTPTENSADRKRHGRTRNGRDSLTHCKHGHVFDEKNTYRKPDGTRQCRTCQLQRGRDFYLKWGGRKANV